VGHAIRVRAAQERNERLFFRVLVEHFEELKPVMSDATVREACRCADRALTVCARMCLTTRQSQQLRLKGVFSWKTLLKGACVRVHALCDALSMCRAHPQLGLLDLCAMCCWGAWLQALWAHIQSHVWLCARLACVCGCRRYGLMFKAVLCSVHGWLVHMAAGAMGSCSRACPVPCSSPWRTAAACSGS